MELPIDIMYCISEFLYPREKLILKYMFNVSTINYDIRELLIKELG